MKRIKTILIMALVLETILLSGCLDTNPVAGTYKETDNNKSYFVLYPDNTFNQFYYSGESSSGTFRLVDDGHIVMTYQPFGEVSSLVQNGSEWLKDGKYHYVKTK